MAEVAAPYNSAEAVVRSDTIFPVQPYTGLYIATAGDVTVLMFGNQTVTFPAVPAGTVLRIGVKRVNLTGTVPLNANIIGMW